MRKIIFSLLFCSSFIFIGCGDQKVKDANDSNGSTEVNASFEKQGFLTTEWCLKQGMFKDCRMESIACGEEGCNKKWEIGDDEKTQLVLYSHDDLQSYKLDLSNFKNIGGLLEDGVNQDQVTIKGDLTDNNKTIIVKGYEAPPPPAKSFFKGCL
jgi:hypothetical protein